MSFKHVVMCILYTGELIIKYYSKGLKLGKSVLKYVDIYIETVKSDAIPQL